MACEAFPDSVLEEVPVTWLSPRCIRAMHQRTYRGNSPCVRWAHPTPTPSPYPYPLPPSRPCPNLCQVLAKQGKEWAKPEAGELGAGRSRPMERSGEAKERRGGEGRKPAAADRTAEPEE